MGRRRRRGACDLAAGIAGHRVRRARAARNAVGRCAGCDHLQRRRHRPGRGAILSHKAVGLQAARAAADLGLGPDDERLSLTPIHFVLERVVGIYASLLAGTVINFSESPDTALANLVELKPR